MIGDQPHSIVDAILWSLFLFPAGIACVAFGFMALRFEWEKQKERADVSFYEWLQALLITLMVFAISVSLGVYMLWDSVTRFLPHRSH